jgi:hypothetical protein
MISRSRIGSAAHFIAQRRKTVMKPDGLHFSVVDYGHSEGDFEYVKDDEAVYVIYKPTGFRRMYDAASWKDEFEEDLKNRIFNPPS